MKDMYELLQDINIDIDDYEEIEVSELEKQRVKNHLRKSVKKKKRSWKKNSLIAVVILGLSITAVGLAFPTYASNIPIIGNIFASIDGEQYADFQKFSDEVGITKTSNGIAITINDAVFDGETVYLTFSIKSEQDLGETPIIEEFPTLNRRSGGGGYTINKISETHYIGVVQVDSERDKDVAKVRWQINNIQLSSMENTEEKINGNWKFAFSLAATENEEQVVNKSIEEDGVQVIINKLIVTPMSIIVDYEHGVSPSLAKQWDSIMGELTIKDDLGNKYRAIGGQGNSVGDNVMEWRYTFGGKIDPNATKLIVTPMIFLNNFDENNEEVSVTEERNGTKESTATTTIDENGRNQEERILEDIVIKLQ